MNKNDLRPATLEDFVGQEPLKAKLRIYINDALRQKRPLPHMLLVSEPGQGKTSLATIIAAETGDPITVFDLSKAKPGALASFIRRFEGGIVLFDEFHRATKAQQEGVLELLDEGFVTTPGGGKVYATWFTAIAATTEPDQITKAVFDRFAFRPKFATYSDEEMALIVTGMAEKIGREMDPEVARVLGTASAGVPRQARNLVGAWDALSSGRDEDEKVSADEVLELSDVYADGLTEDHLSVLKTLERMDGMAGQSALCNVLAMHPKTLSAMEKLLYRRDYIIYTPRGRELTSKGFERLRPASAVTTVRRSREMAA